VLVSVHGVTERGDTNSSDIEVDLGAAVYLGQEEDERLLRFVLEPGSHRYATATIEERHLYNESSDDTFSPRPDEDLIGYAKCRQYTSDLDRSAVPGDPPWVTREPDGPETERRYTLTAGPTDFYDEGTPEVSLSSLPAPVRSFVERVRNRSGNREYFVMSANLSRSTYVRLHDALVDRSVESVEDVPDEGADAPGLREVATWDDRRADCRAYRYDGVRGHRVEYVVELDSEVWQFELAHLDEWRGEIDVPTVDERETGDLGRNETDVGT